MSVLIGRLPHLTSISTQHAPIASFGSGCPVTSERLLTGCSAELASHSSHGNEYRLDLKRQRMGDRTARRSTRRNNG